MKGKRGFQKGHNFYGSSETAKRAAKTRKEHGFSMGHAWSDESRKRLKESMKGKIPWNKGKTGIYSKEVIEKIALGQLGRKQTTEHIKKRLDTKKKNGTFDCSTPESIARQIASRKENGKSWHSEEAIEKIRTKRGEQKPTWVSSQEKILTKALVEIGVVVEIQKQVRTKGFLTLVDLYIHSSNLCIYVDGIYWHSFPDRKLRDRETNQVLKKLGYKILRVSDKDINNDLPSVLKRIMRVCK